VNDFIELARSPLLQSVLSWLAGLSFITFVLSLLLIPLFVSRLAPDCFLKLGATAASRPALTAGSVILLILRNAFGLFLLIAGIAMLFLPGQGLLTILLGVLLLSFPGKYRLLNLLLGSRSVRRGLDWLRKKSRKPPFIWPDSTDDAMSRP
jgi:hypothetical protein